MHFSGAGGVSTLHSNDGSSESSGRTLPRRAAGALAAAFRALTGTQLAGRAATVFPDDVFLTSYPRSGNTWARFLIANLLYPQEATTFRNIESRVAEIYFNPDHRLRRLRRPRVLKSHEAFDPNYPRVIYVVRDPRDVAVSLYHHAMKWRNISENYPLEEFVPRFVAAEFERPSGSWGDNAGSWLAMRQGSSTFLLLRYEDMLAEPSAELRTIVTFLKSRGFATLDDTNENLARVVELSSVERMRLLEIRDAGRYPQLKQTRRDKPFIRNAQVGEWRTALSARSARLIEQAWGPTMERLGYARSI